MLANVNKTAKFDMHNWLTNSFWEYNLHFLLKTIPFRKGLKHKRVFNVTTMVNKDLTSYIVA